MEFLTEAAGKNLHLEHLEDEILNFGVAGGRGAIEFLQSLRDMFKGGQGSTLNVTVKWDGAPALFCGPHPETGKFFVAKKSLFNKTPKFYHTNDEIDVDLTGELAKKFKVALAEFPKLGMTEILQGDLMFTDDTSTMDIDGTKHITFQPNTILYAVESDSQIGREIQNAKIGIVWHTTYKGNSIDTLSASFGAKIPGKSSRVWQDDATYRDVSGKANFTASETVKVTKLLSEAGKQFHRINSGSFNNFMKWQDSLGASAVGSGFKTYLNTYTRAGKKLPKGKKAVQGYINHFTTWWKKNKSDNDVQNSKLREHLKVIKKSLKTLESVVDFMRFLIEAKLMIIKKMDSAKGLAKTFVKTDNGLKVVAPEGYVAIDKTGGAVKIVDKMEFSFNNFTVAKNWDK
ncbi:hypothetical protein N9159_00130 [bacterium]|nr:hypothetical protein [bacterium]|tara:strand:+ start:2319 stop:3521 length:1203 start_codon:yes stop_codon:yes gene_type:complete